MSASEGHGEQRRIDDFVDIDSDRCVAIAETTSKRCKHESLAGVDYCQIHLPRQEPDKNRL